MEGRKRAAAGFGQSVNGKTEVKLFTRCLCLLCLSLLAAGTGCRTAASPEKFDFSAPGWGVQRGQAVWQPPGKRPEIAGELLLATNRNGDFFVQFSKIPFPIVTANVSSNHWQIEFGDGWRAWAGQGTPPQRLLWFQLPKAVRGAEAGPRWKFAAEPDGRWRLESARGHERLEGAFFP